MLAHALLARLRDQWGDHLKLRRAALRFLAEHLVGNLLSSAAQQIGEAIGKRVGAKIYTEPPGEEEDEDVPDE